MKVINIHVCRVCGRENPRMLSSTGIYCSSCYSPLESVQDFAVFRITDTRGVTHVCRGVFQERVGHGRGQCTEASYATVLGKNLDDIPDLWTGSLEEPRSEENWLRMHAWMRSIGRAILTIKFPPKPPTYTVEDLMRDHEIDLRWLPWSTSLHCVGGDNQDGLGHSTVGYMGRMVFNPNRNGLGLKNIQDYTLLLTKEYLPAEIWDGGIGGLIDLSGE